MFSITQLFYRALPLWMRGVSTAPNKITAVEQRAKAWQVHSYGEGLQKSDVRVPPLQGPNELLIKVNATSVNPIDLAMADGYGRTIFNVRRRWQMELPLTLGRDFCGTVLHKGQGVGEKFEVGDQVYGFVPIHQQGSFSEIIIADTSQICKKPENLTDLECTSLVYASMTAWGALFVTAGLGNVSDPTRTKVLVLGGSGGVGTAAVQLLHAQQFKVHATCSTDAIDLVRSLGATAYDYKDPNHLKEIGKEDFEVILDCAKFGYQNIPPYWKYNQFVTLNSPLLINTDHYGLIGGSLCSLTSLLRTNYWESWGRKGSVKWGFFVASPTGFELINRLINEAKIMPKIHKVFDFDNLPDAFEEVRKGHLRGKVVVQY